MVLRLERDGFEYCPIARKCTHWESERDISKDLTCLAFTKELIDQKKYQDILIL